MDRGGGGPGASDMGRRKRRRLIGNHAVRLRREAAPSRRGRRGSGSAAARRGLEHGPAGRGGGGRRGAGDANGNAQGGTRLRALGFAATSSAAAPQAPRPSPRHERRARRFVAAAAVTTSRRCFAIFGSQGRARRVGDEVQDRNDRARFAEIAREKLDVSTDPKRAHRADARRRR